MALANKDCAVQEHIQQSQKQCQELAEEEAGGDVMLVRAGSVV